MKRIAISMVLASALAACATTSAPGGLQSTPLSGPEADKVLKQCSRPTPVFTATRALTGSEIRSANANLGKLASMRDSDGRGIRPLNEYVYQYVGIVHAGTNKVYVNAIMPPPDDIIWKKQALIMCDGGDRAFGALYNPATQTFSDLEINGSFAKGR